MPTLLSPTVNLSVNLCVMLYVMLFVNHLHTCTATSPSPTICPLSYPYHLPKPSRIIGGLRAHPSLQSYLAFMHSPSGLCTGVLISPTLLLSAAHCNISTDTPAILSASRATTTATTTSSASDGVSVPISRVLSPSAFSDPSLSDDFRWAHDIAFVQLARRAPSSAKVMWVNTNASVPSANAFARVLGYGAVHFNNDDDNNINNVSTPFFLNQVDVPVVHHPTCQQAYRDANLHLHSDLQLCAGSPQGGCDACRGDSGGPLFQYDKHGHPVVVAIVSRGVDCGHPDYPGIYVRVSHYADLIRATFPSQQIVFVSQVSERFDASIRVHPEHNDDDRSSSSPSSSVDNNNNNNNNNPAGSHSQNDKHSHKHNRVSPVVVAASAAVALLAGVVVAWVTVALVLRRRRRRNRQEEGEEADAEAEAEEVDGDDDDSEMVKSSIPPSHSLTSPYTTQPVSLSQQTFEPSQQQQHNQQQRQHDIPEDSASLYALSIDSLEDPVTPFPASSPRQPRYHTADNT